jgi:hypothetical protein
MPPLTVTVSTVRYCTLETGKEENLKEDQPLPATHCLRRRKSFSIFPSPAGMSLTKLSLGRNNLFMTSLFPPRESLVSDIPAGGGNIEKLFYGVYKLYFDFGK